MTLDITNNRWVTALVIAIATALQGCDQKPVEAPRVAASEETVVQSSLAPYQPITIEHALGTTVINHLPQRVAAFDMNDVDSLDQLGVPVAGMAKDYVPHFLTKYKDDPDVRDLGAIVQPNLESVYTLQPDLILISPVQAQSYKELTEIAPTLHFDWDLLNEHGDYIGVAKEHLITLGKIFGREELAREKAAEIDAKVEEALHVTEGRSEKALIVMHNNGAFSSFGVRSRYGFIFDTLGVKSASKVIEPGLHGQPISSEFINEANPDILYVVDRTAVMERRPVLNAEAMQNPLLRQTNAWKNGRVVFVDAQAWYVTAASVTSLKIIIDEVIKGYRD